MNVLKNIRLNFLDKKIITIDAKQYDESSRFILASCYSDEKEIFLDSQTISAFIRYKKPDGYEVFNTCTITSEGKIQIELSKQMLIAEGLATADILITEKSENPPFISSSGNIEFPSSASILSTMKFYVNVIAAPYDYQNIETSPEYEGLNDLLTKVNQDYSIIIVELRKIRDAAKISETNAKQSETNAKKSETNASSFANKAKSSESNAKTSETNSLNSANRAESSESNARTSETNALNSANKALVSESNAKTSETNAFNFAKEAEGWAIGRTDLPDRQKDNSKYYSEQSKNSLNEISKLSQTIEGYKNQISIDKGIIELDKQEIANMKNSVSEDKNLVNASKLEINQIAKEIKEYVTTTQGYITELDKYKAQIEQDKITIANSISSAQQAAKQSQDASVSAQESAQQASKDKIEVENLTKEVRETVNYLRSEIISSTEPTVAQDEGDYWLEPY